MKYQISPSQNQKLQNLMLSMIEDIMPENVNVEFDTRNETYDDINEVEDINEIEDVNFYDAEDYNRLFIIRLKNLLDFENEHTPELVMEYYIEDKLNGLFGKKRWHEQMKKWIEYNHPDVKSLYDKIKSVS
jgi:hypothetical protein